MNFQPEKPSLFWKIYIGIVIFLVFLLLTGGVLLVSFLSSFENCQPIHPAQEAFHYYFEEGNFEAALKAANFKTDSVENLSLVANSLKEQAKSKVFTLCETQNKDGIASFNVVLTAPLHKQEKLTGEKEANTKIATLRFQKSKEKNFWGLSPYKFSEIEIFYKGQTDVTCAIPEHYTLIVNGQTLTETQVKEKEAHEWNQYLPEDANGITLNVYEMKGLFTAPTLLCRDKEGVQTQLIFNEKASRYEAAITYEKEVDEALKNRILDGMKEYAKYIQDDGSLGKVATYFDKKSMFYKNTAGNPSSFVWDHNGYEFKNEVAEDFFFFDETTLCCHISFDQVLKKTGREDYIDHLDMTVFVKKIGGKWQIFDRIVR